MWAKHEWTVLISVLLVSYILWLSVYDASVSRATQGPQCTSLAHHCFVCTLFVLNLCVVKRVNNDVYCGNQVGFL